MTLDLEKIKQNKTGFLLGFSIPAVIAMVLSSLVSVVDGFFIGNYVGSEGLAAVNLGLPIVYLFCAVGLMIGVGGSVLGGIYNGEGNITKARTVFTQTMILVLIAGVALSTFVFAFFEPMLNFLRAEGLVRQCFYDYYKIISFEYPMMILIITFGMFIRADGKPQYTMGVTFFTVALNIILDYAFSKMGFGIKGIAIASVITGAVGILMSVLYITKKAVIYRFARFKFDRSEIAKTFTNGSSEFIGEMASVISMFCYNLVIMRTVGSKGVSAFTVAGYMIYVFSMIVIGFGQGMCPLVSFSYGAKALDVSKDLRKLTNRFVFGLGVFFALLLFFGGNFYASLFSNDKEIVGMVTTGLKFLCASFILMGFNVVASMYFTSCGKALPSAVISMARGLVILLALIFTLPRFFGLNGVWATAPLTEIFTLAITIGFFVKTEMCK